MEPTGQPTYWPRASTLRVARGSSECYKVLKSIFIFLLGNIERVNSPTSAAVETLLGSPKSFHRSRSGTSQCSQLGRRRLSLYLCFPKIIILQHCMNWFCIMCLWTQLLAIVFLGETRHALTLNCAYGHWFQMLQKQVSGTYKWDAALDLHFEFHKWKT